MRILVVAATYKTFLEWFGKNRSNKYDQHIWVPRADYLRGISGQSTKVVFAPCAKKHPEYAQITQLVEAQGL